MKLFSTILLLMSSTLIISQNVNYTVEVVQFEADDTGCTSDGFGFDEEVTWHCWAMDDDQVTGWTNDSGDDCYGKDSNTPIVLVPNNTALLSQSNSAATSITIRLEAWEDDNAFNSVGSADRCSYDSGDDCHSDVSTAITFRNDPDCNWNQYTINSGDFHVIVRIKWEYSNFTAGFDATECGVTLPLTGQGSGTWSVFSGTSGSFVDVNDPSTTFSGILGSYSLLWNSLPGCQTQYTADTVTIDFVSAPVPNIQASTATICEGNDVIFSAQDGTLYDWSLNTIGNIVSSSGSGQYTLTPSLTDVIVFVSASNGTCSGTDSYSFTVNPSPSPTIVDNGSYLSTQTFPVYLWYLNGSPISGATSINYTPTQSGSYYVEVVNSNGCVGQSDPFSFSGVGIEELNSDIAIYPNPTNGTININSDYKIENIVIYNSIGKKEIISKNGNAIDLSHLSDGIYFLNITVNNEIITKRIFLSK